MNKLQELKLRIEHSEAEDREPIDFDVRDSESDERYATVWGSNPTNDLQWDCEHPEELIEFGDEDERAVCPICGATFDWGYTPDVAEGEDCDGNYYAREIKVRTIGECHEADKPAGIIGDIIKDIERRF